MAKSQPKVGKLFASFSASEVIQAQVDFLVRDGEYTQAQAERLAYDDPDIVQEAYEDLCDELTYEIKRVNGSGRWYVEVSNFGWQKLNGCSFIDADDGRTLLRKVLPRTDNTFEIYRLGRKGFAIQNRHHDSRYGEEWYYVRPAHLA